MSLEGIKFVKGPGNKKYTAILKNGKKVHFGDASYQQYKDSIPKELGGQLWAHMNHLDVKRRRDYQKRHGAMRDANGKRYIDEVYSPAWFSYNYLW